MLTAPRHPTVIEHAPSFPPEALDLTGPRSAPTHDVLYDFDSYDANGQPVVEKASYQAYGEKQAKELADCCRKHPFKRNVRIVPRGGVE
jgi:hypothetical protein